LIQSYAIDEVDIAIQEQISIKVSDLERFIDSNGCFAEEGHMEEEEHIEEEHIAEDQVLEKKILEKTDEAGEIEEKGAEEEEEVEELNEEEFDGLDAIAGSLPENSVMDSYLTEIQEELRGGKLPSPYKYKTFWVQEESLLLLFWSKILIRN
jgi:hypothetical protein